jgi:putative oxidoreductase
MTTHTSTLPDPSLHSSTHASTHAGTHASTAGSRGLRAALWITQGLLALAFGFAGTTKAFAPLADAAKNIPWIPDVPAALVRFIGTAELLAAVGLILPALTRIRPTLTPLAASGLVLIMSLASIFHLTRGEPQGVVINVIVGGLAAFVAWGRFRAAPIAPSRR